MTTKPRLLLIGCGKMGGALLQRLGHEMATCVVDHSPKPALTQTFTDLLWLNSLENIAANFTPDIIILAVKPQQMATALPICSKFKNSVFLSIAAGLPILRLAELLNGDNFAIVRSMPNLPASIGEGMSVAVANKNVSAEQRVLCDKALSAVGKVAWVEDEKLIDAVTALSGSGPAYVFALCETMAKAGEALGLPASMAQQLARQTIIGSGALLAQSPETAEALRIAVTSPGGTTEAALKHLLATNGFPDLIHTAMQAAATRAKELAQKS